LGGRHPCLHFGSLREQYRILRLVTLPKRKPPFKRKIQIRINGERRKNHDYKKIAHAASDYFVYFANAGLGWDVSERGSLELNNLASHIAWVKINMK
jgi:hypothetical protein